MTSPSRLVIYFRGRSCDLDKWPESGNVSSPAFFIGVAVRTLSKTKEYKMERLVAIDPLSLILRSDIYVRLHLPDPAPIEILQKQVRDAIHQLSPEERRATLAHVKQLAIIAGVVEKELTQAAQTAA
jgi:hypothetical protein